MDDLLDLDLDFFDNFFPDPDLDDLVNILLDDFMYFDQLWDNSFQFNNLMLLDHFLNDLFNFNQSWDLDYYLNNFLDDLLNWNSLNDCFLHWDNFLFDYLDFLYPFLNHNVVLGVDLHFCHFDDLLNNLLYSLDLSVLN